MSTRLSHKNFTIISDRDKLFRCLEVRFNDLLCRYIC